VRFLIDSGSHYNLINACVIHSVSKSSDINKEEIPIQFTICNRGSMSITGGIYVDLNLEDEIIIDGDGGLSDM
jgi:hypothetical protein